ncbi:bifunctional adenosylcobinamide kinase/adenosylcobinamide-phosphate guanylyltransferase [Halomonas sp. KAO]|uniref:bifunctional adenosylcobinamide kinase/adenosylcobinamide-phosphate guanylyltransferase n=1 Tax=Halomonas sp. KAO TaxID=2783858 RepID=UPI00189F0AEF|nr:bifunctional adenosylcobinamide kinase/adenosylcobinamide-phosphate guanylyltransferase [Halomonas sp. KAO]MBF7053401.1 bifunctional adenosylcobinamide kinase/adenosylcobinamide-phosphate guanylyltransferase [Halomonas sp. KAO]
MQCFIGGACSGRRELVSKRFPAAHWERLNPGEGVADWLGDLPEGATLVVTGWAGWLTAAQAEVDDDGVRASWRAMLEALAAQETRGLEVVLILDEMGRGIVPMAPEARRLRDLNGWLVQEVASRCSAVWYVRHGLARRLDLAQ